MTDILTVRDHSQPCEHQEMGEDGWGNPVGAIQYDTDGKWPAFWECSWDECPGGREIKLLRWLNLKGGYDIKTSRLWVEVTE